MITRSAIASALSTRCSESTTAHRACSTEAEKRLGAGEIELRGRLVEQEKPRLERERRGETDALQLPARELDGSPRCQVRSANLAKRRLDARPDRLRRHSEVLEAERDLVLDPHHHDLVLGILEDRRHRPRELGGAGRAGVPAVHLDPTREPAAMEVRHEPGQRPQQRRLAAAGGPEQRHHLTLVELEREVAYRRSAAGVREREAADLG